MLHTSLSTMDQAARKTKIRQCHGRLIVNVNRVFFADVAVLSVPPMPLTPHKSIYYC